MAVIGRIRKHSVLLLIIVAVALLAFILGDFVRKRNSGAKDFIKVGSDEISYYEYLDKYNYYSDLLKKQNAENVESQASSYTYNEMVDSLILSKQTQALGISVTADELRDLMAGPNPHEYAKNFFRGQDGNYDMRLAQNFLANFEQVDSMYKSIYLNLESYVEKETLQKKYLNLLSKAYYTPKAFARKTQEENQMRANLYVTHIPYSNELVADNKIKFTEEDVQKWYEDNLYRFPQDEELRNIDYVIFDVKPSSQDLLDIEKEVREKYEIFKTSETPHLFINTMVDAHYDSSFVKRKVLSPHIDSLLFNAPVGSFVEPFIEGDNWMFAKLLATETRPDSVHISYMFISKEGVQNAPRKEEESKKLVDSAFMDLMKGKNFYEVATKFSDVKPDPRNDSLRMWLMDGSNQSINELYTTIQELFDTTCTLMPGMMMQYKNKIGTWILIVNQRTAVEKKIQVALGKKIIEASIETIDNIESAANNFANGIESYDAFDKKVKDLNLNKRNFDRLTAMAYNIPGATSNAREIVRWAFDENTDKGSISPVFNLQNMFVVVTLKSIYPKGHMDLEQVRTFAETMVKRDKKAEKLTAMLKGNLAKSKDLYQIATQYKSNVDTVSVAFSDRNFGHYGPESGLIGKIFAQNKLNEVLLLKGDMGMYVIKIFAVTSPSSLKVNEQDAKSVEMYQQQQSMMYQNQVQNSMQKLRKLYKIKDYRYKMF